MLIGHQYERHILILAVIVILAGFVAASDAWHARSEEIIVLAEGVISRIPVLGMLVFVLLAMLSGFTQAGGLADAMREAKAGNKTLMVVFRCVP